MRIKDGRGLKKLHFVEGGGGKGGQEVEIKE